MHNICTIISHMESERYAVGKVHILMGIPESITISHLGSFSKFRNSYI